MGKSIVPAPWDLQGNSVIQVVLNPVEEVRHLVPAGYQIKSVRGLTTGALMWVHYTQSPVGPYEEFIFIPARVQVKAKTGYHMSHIWVDSAASVESGRANWWLPKKLGSMVYQEAQGNIDASLHEGDTGLVSLHFEPVPMTPSVPMHSFMFPMPLIQERGGRNLYVPFGGWGWVRPLVGSFHIEERDLVPIPAASKRFPAMRLNRFRMRFSAGEEI